MFGNLTLKVDLVDEAKFLFIPNLNLSIYNAFCMYQACIASIFEYRLKILVWILCLG